LRYRSEKDDHYAIVIAIFIIFPEFDSSQKDDQKGIMMNYIRPLIVVEDVNRSRFLYEKLLKQKGYSRSWRKCRI